MILGQEARSVMLESLAVSMGAPNRMRFVAVLLDAKHEPMSEPVEFEGVVSVNGGKDELRFDFAELHLKTTHDGFCTVCRVSRADDPAIFVDLPIGQGVQASRDCCFPFLMQASFSDVSGAPSVAQATTTGQPTSPVKTCENCGRPFSDELFEPGHCGIAWLDSGDWADDTIRDVHANCDEATVARLRTPEGIISALRALSEDDRAKVSGSFCGECHRPLDDGESCHCWNDE